MWFAWVAVWIAVIAIGVGFAASYEVTPGAQAAAPARWPADSPLPRVPHRGTIVMFVHPRCTCTRASLTELAAIMGTAANDATAVVAFLHPEGASQDWEHTDTWATAGELPRTTRYVDRDGREATRFGARTSGHVVVYDADGTLVFEGGITASRGHPGDNIGRRSVLAHVTHTGTSEHVHDVFGCALEDR